MDAVTLMRPITKWSVQVGGREPHRRVRRRGLPRGASERPGARIFELPLDVLMNMADDGDGQPSPPPPAPARPGAFPDALAQADDLLARAQRPVFLVGSQLRWSPRREALATYADQIGAPFYLNGMARGALPHEHPTRMSRSRRFALAQADVAFVLGTPFDFRLDYGRSGTFHPDVKVVQVDLDGAELGKNREVDVSLHADSGLVLEALAAWRHADGGQTAPSGWRLVRADEDKRQRAMHAQWPRPRIRLTPCTFAPRSASGSGPRT